MTILWDGSLTLIVALFALAVPIVKRVWLCQSRGLNQENLVAWEEEFAGYLDEFGRHQNIEAVLSDLENLFQKYRIGLRERGTPKTIVPEALDVVCYISSFRDAREC